jgi:uncharacterized membrane protein required for colicin V production
MGLDLTLGALVLIAAIRGWFRGFFLQAIGLSALVACVYLADPVRDFSRPHAIEYLPTMRPELLDKLLWWAGAVLSYLVLSGLGKGILRASRRRPYGLVEPRRGDQGAGFLLGALKGTLVVAFLAAALMRHAQAYIQAGGYVEEQVKTSQVLAWSEQYRPAERIWKSAPVQSFVTRIQSRGLWMDPPAPAPAPKANVAAETTPPAQTAARPKTLALPEAEPRPLDPNDPDFLTRLDETLRREGIQKSR